MDLSILSGAISSLNGATSVANALLNMKSFNDRAAEVTKLNDLLLKTQQGLLAHNALLLTLQEEHSKATDKIRELSETLAQRESYSEFELTPGNFVYRVNLAPQQGGADEPGRSKPLHYACQFCLDRGIRSIFALHLAGDREVQICHSCERAIKMPRDPGTARKGPLASRLA